MLNFSNTESGHYLSFGLLDTRRSRPYILFHPFINAPVAQLDRVLDYESRGRTFESCRVHHEINRDGRCGLPVSLCAKLLLNYALVHLQLKHRVKRKRFSETRNGSECIVTHQRRVSSADDTTSSQTLRPSQKWCRRKCGGDGPRATVSLRDQLLDSMVVMVLCSSWLVCHLRAAARMQCYTAHVLAFGAKFLCLRQASFHPSVVKWRGSRCS